MSELRAPNSLPSSFAAPHLLASSAFVNSALAVPITVVSICGAMRWSSYDIPYTFAPSLRSFAGARCDARVGDSSSSGLRRRRPEGGDGARKAAASASTVEREVAPTTLGSPVRRPLRSAATGEESLSSHRRRTRAATRYDGFVCCICGGGSDDGADSSEASSFLPLFLPELPPGLLLLFPPANAGFVAHTTGPFPTGASSSSSTPGGTLPSNSSTHAAIAISAWAATSGG
mmetsp:Transcript_26911/g.64595  ORF Transcript_26911/g.64595 Transcript_26911/m.64595 type:complete len:231 (+) Transcript_26911:724-1416(+)